MKYYIAIWRKPDGSLEKGMYEDDSMRAFRSHAKATGKHNGWELISTQTTPSPSEKTVHREVVHKKDCKALQYEDGDDCTCHALSGTGHAKKEHTNG